MSMACRRRIWANLSEEAARERVTVARGPVAPGSEAQIDYGKLGMWFDPVSGRRVAVWVFAMILSCSRALFVQPVLRMDQTSWNASHVAAFEFFGGYAGVDPTFGASSARRWEHSSTGSADAVDTVSFAFARSGW